MSVSSIDLLRPALLALLPAALLVLLVGLWGLRQRGRERSRLVAPAQLARFLPDHSGGRTRLRVLLASAAILLLGISLLGPVLGYSLQEVVGHGLDLVVCVDTSRSMLAEDVRPSRLERAKREVRGLLAGLQGDRAALIAFSGGAREVSPLTHDRIALAELLARVSPADNRRGGTDVAAALDRALDLFDGRTGAHEAIVLVTDGEDLEGRGARLAAEAKERGIRLFVVGVGTSAGGRIPVVGADGREGFLLDEGGEEVLTRMDRGSLEHLAEITGGAFLSTQDHPAPLEELYLERISRIEGRELVGGLERIPHDRYQWPLLVGLACMLGETGLRERRRRRR